MSRINSEIVSNATTNKEFSSKNAEDTYQNNKASISLNEQATIFAQKASDFCQNFTETYEELFVDFDTDDFNSNLCSALYPWDIIAGKSINNLVESNDTKNGRIEYTKQGKTKNCWVLSGINSLSYTDAGSEIIKNALEYHDNFTIVHLNEGDYVVQDTELEAAQASVQYSSGDDDMLLFELAIEKVLNQIANRDIELTDYAPEYLMADANIKQGISTVAGHSSTDGGTNGELWYLVTGKHSEEMINRNKIEDALQEFKENRGKNIAMACSISSLDNKDVEGLYQDEDGEYYIIDVFKRKQKLGTSHAYSIKSATNDEVTIANPWNSKDAFVLSHKQYLALFDRTCRIDLSDDNPKYKVTTYNVTDNDGNDKNFKNREIKYNEDGNVDWVAYWN